MADGEGSAEDDARMTELFDCAGQLEGKIITTSNFGDVLDDTVKSLASLTIKTWGRYMETRGLMTAPRVNYASRHILALGDWLAGEIQFDAMWSDIQNVICRRYEPEKDHSRLIGYVQRYFKTELAQTSPK
jgi:hypothetical protein